MDFKRRNLNFSSYIFIISVVVLAAGLSWLPVSERLNNLFYDLQLSFNTKPAPDDIVIIAIDQKSLNEIGNWPWPRSVHASLLEQLTAAKTQIIIFDVLFTDPDRFNPENDNQLGLAIKNNGRVILPVNLEPVQIGGQFVERLPLPSFTASAAGLGHVNVDLDADGILRKVNLNIGLGDAFWSHLGFSALKLVQPESVFNLHETPLRYASESLHSWRAQKTQEILIPFLGPPGSFTHISYSDVLFSRIPSDLLQDKVVFVGATATGLGDYLPTPMMGTLSGMSGVEINANIYDGLRKGELVSPVNKNILLVVALLFGVLYVLVLVFTSPNMAIFISLLSIFLTIMISVVLLEYFRIWYPPAGTIILIVIAYSVWSWLRLRSFYISISKQLASLEKNKEKFSTTSPSFPKVTQDYSLQFLAEIFSIEAWRVSSLSGETLLSEGGIIQQALPSYDKNEWQLSAGYARFHADERNVPVVIEINWTDKEDLPFACFGLVLDAVFDWVSGQDVVSQKLELMEEQTQKLENISRDRYIYLQLLSNSLEAMHGGMLILDGRGRIILANTMARDLFGINFNEKSPLFIESWQNLAGIQLLMGKSWKDLFKIVLVENCAVQAEAQSRDGEPLLIDLTPVKLSSSALLVVNISNISFIKALEKERAETIQFLSHDLRSPMVSLLALSDIYKDKNNIAGDELREVFSQIAFYAKKNLTLMDQFIQLARVESEAEFTLGFIDFFEVLEEAMLEVSASAKNKGIILLQEYEIADAWVTGNTDLLIRVVVNLLSNAIKYSYEASEVTIRLYEHKGLLYCSIKDTGFGINQDELKHLFKRFYRSSNLLSKKEQGLGLGLRFVQVAIDKLGGKIEVESELGKGSCFTISFPLVDMGPLSSTIVE